MVIQSEDNEQLRQLDDFMARLARVMQVQKSTDDMDGLTTTQVFILRYLDKHDLVKASEISKAVGLSPGAVTQVCDELVKNEMILRDRSVVDRRVVHIAITAKGRAVLERIRSVRTERLFRVVQLLGKPDADEFVRIVGRVVGIIEQLRSDESKGGPR